MARLPKSTQSVSLKILTDFDKCVEAVASQQVPITKNGQSKEMTAMEAVLQKQFMTAIAGSPHAQNQFLRNVQHTEQIKREIMDADIKVWTRIKHRQQEFFKAHQEEHGCEPDIQPHPNDIMISYETGVIIDGPMNKEAARNVQNTIATIDAWLCQHALDRARSRQRKDFKLVVGDALYVANFLNQCLPKRLQYPDAAMIDKMMELTPRPIRWLLKETYAAWRKAGQPIPRGAYAPPPEKMIGVFNATAETMQWVMRNKQSLPQMQGIIEQAVAKHMR